MTYIHFRLMIILTILAVPTLLPAQNNQRSQGAEQIIITKKGAGDEKLNIVLDGDHVSINGRPAESGENADITVKRRKIKDLNAFNEEANAGKEFSFRSFPPSANIVPNKAMLGVVTKKNDRGAEIVNVSPNSAAEGAGLQPGDIIIEVDHQPINTPDDLNNIIKTKDAGNIVSVVFYRDNKQKTVVAKLKKYEANNFNIPDNMGAMPPMDLNEIFRDFQGRLPRSNQNFNMQFNSSRPKLGIKVQDLQNEQGVKITEVQSGSNAATAGLQPGDVVKDIDGRRIENTDDIMARTSNLRERETLHFKIERNGRLKNVNVNIAKKVKTADL